MHAEAPLAKPSALNPFVQLPSAAEANPWLSLPEVSTTALSRKRNQAQVSKDSDAASKAVARTTKAKARTEDARLAERDEAELAINLASTLGAGAVRDDDSPAFDMRPSRKSRKKTVEPRSSGKEPLQPAADDCDSNPTVAKPAISDDVEDEEDDDDEPKQVARGGRVAFEQRELVARAFANDDVVAVGASHSCDLPLCMRVF